MMNLKIVTFFRQKTNNCRLGKKPSFLKSHSCTSDFKNNEKKKGSLPVFTVIWNKTDTFSFKVSV